LLNKNNYWAIIPAAGTGSRMGSALPKQYLMLHHKPILQHTIERLCLPEIKKIVVCVATDDAHWNTLHLPDSVMRVEGGKERCHSVLNGLYTLQQWANPQDWVLVHDAARPCVRATDIQHLMSELAEHPVGGLLALRVRDTMKRTDSENNVTETVERINLWHALTPQMFRLQPLLNALQHHIQQNELVTDEAQAMEKQGFKPVLIEGHADNIKITHPQDLELADLYLHKQYAY